LPIEPIDESWPIEPAPLPVVPVAVPEPLPVVPVVPVLPVDPVWATAVIAVRSPAAASAAIPVCFLRSIASLLVDDIRF
jgi:hypothetical protein